MTQKLPEQQIEEFLALRDSVRKQEGGGGYCHIVSEILGNKLGWEQKAGTYTDLNGDVICSGHCWNKLKDGTIIDVTADQFGEMAGVKIIDPADPEYKRYRDEWFEDYNPDLHLDYPELKGIKWSGELDWEQQDRLVQERGRGWWLSDKTLLRNYEKAQEIFADEYTKNNESSRKFASQKFKK